MTTVAQHSTQVHRRNEGGRYSARSTWYDAIAQENIARLEAMDAQATVATLATVVGNAVSAMPEAASRIARAAHLVQAKDVWRMTDGTFIVGSESDTVKAYLVQRHPWRCECKAAQHQAGPCKHVVAVWISLRMGAAYQPLYG